MRILALDTTSHFGSIALLEDDRTLEEILLHAPDGFGEILFGQIERVLDRHGWKVQQIDCFACASGPGSFTGVRLGLTAVKGLGETLGKPVVGVSNLEALAECGDSAMRAAVLDARRGEIYGAVFDAQMRAAREEVVMPFPAWLETLPEGDIEFISPDFGPFRNALGGTRFAHSKVLDQRAVAAAVGRIARQRALKPLQDVAGVDANYVRRSDAELFLKG